MKQKSTVFLTLIILLSVVVLSGCGYSSNKKFNTGFGYRGYIETSLWCAAESDKTEFDVDDLTLDFAFGWFDSIGTATQYPYARIDKLLVCIAVYFTFGQDTFNEIISEGDFSDYKNIENLSFVKEIPTEKFCSQEYKVTTNMLRGSVFSHKETLTVPVNVLKENEGVAQFVIAAIYRTDDNQNYCFSKSGECGYIDLLYSIDENGKVVLSTLYR